MILSRQVEPIQTYSKYKDEITINSYGDRKRLNRYKLEKYSVLVKKFPQGVDDYNLKCEFIDGFEKFIDEDHPLIVNIDNVEKIHKFALELRIPLIMEITTPFLIFLKINSDCFTQLSSDNGELVNSAYSFLAHYFPLIYLTPQFKNMTERQFINLLLSDDFDFRYLDCYFRALDMLCSGWNDDRIIEILKLISRRGSITRTTYVQSKQITNQYKYKDYLPSIIYSEPADFSYLWDEFSNSFSPAAFTEKEIESFS